MRYDDGLLGTCENAFWDGWDQHRPKNFRYCDQPAMNLFRDQRNLCVKCGAKGEGFRDRLAADMVERFEVEGAAKWLAGQYARYVEQSLWAYQFASERKPLEQVRKQQKWADMTAHLINAMVARWGNEIRAAIRRGVVDPNELGLQHEDLELVA